MHDGVEARQRERPDAVPRSPVHRRRARRAQPLVRRCRAREREHLVAHPRQAWGSGARQESQLPPVTRIFILYSPFFFGLRMARMARSRRASMTAGRRAAAPCAACAVTCSRAAAFAESPALVRRRLDRPGQPAFGGDRPDALHQERERLLGGGDAGSPWSTRLIIAA